MNTAGSPAATTCASPPASRAPPRAVLCCAVLCCFVQYGARSLVEFAAEDAHVNEVARENALRELVHGDPRGARLHARLDRPQAIEHRRVHLSPRGAGRCGGGMRGGKGRRETHVDL
jgi:hypothetical protein